MITIFIDAGKGGNSCADHTDGSACHCICLDFVHEKDKGIHLYIFGMCFSLMLEICGVMIFIAKKGGISDEVMHFFYISRGISQQNPVFSDHAQSDGIFSGVGKDVVSVVSDRDGDVLFHAWLYSQEYMAAKGGGCASSADACALFPADLPRYDGEQPWGIQDSRKMDGHLDHVLSDCGGSAAFEGIYRDHDEILPQAVFYDSDLPVFPFGVYIVCITDRIRGQITIFTSIPLRETAESGIFRSNRPCLAISHWWRRV